MHFSGDKVWNFVSSCLKLISLDVASLDESLCWKNGVSTDAWCYIKGYFSSFIPSWTWAFFKLMLKDFAGRFGERPGET